VVASYSRYRDAERAVDYLADHEFPVDRVTIVGRDLRLVEHVTTRMTWGRALLNGALAGGVVGLLIGWLFALFAWFHPAIARGWLIVDGLWFGALVGAAMGALTYATVRGRRDFASVGSMEAGTYDVVVDADVADRAIQLLAQLDPSIQPDGGRAPETATPGRT
jgi:hypothetical protein